MPQMKIVIIGGVAGGASAATRARRLNESAEIVLLEKGEHVSFANCGLPYYIGGQITKRSKLLVATQEDFRAKFRIDVRTRHEAVRIDRAARQVHVMDHTTGRPYTETYDRLILAPGADPILPGWDGLDACNVFTLRDLSDSDRIKAWLDREKPARATVIGAGYIGLEMVESLHGLGITTSLVELQPHVMPAMDDEMASRIETVLAEHGVHLHLGASAEGFDVRQGRVVNVRLADGTILPADMVVISVGVRPNVKLAADAGLATGPYSGIAVNAHQQTSDPNIYAVGDAAEICHLVTDESAYIPLAGPANRNGRTAGEHAATGSAPSATPVAGTSIVGVFGKSAAMTGLSVKAARKAGIDCQAVYAIAGHHAGYYPGAEKLVLKLVFDPASRRILGAQAVGGAGVDKRIDVIATAMRFAGTIDDLAGVDLCYAPQFGSAKDPVHLAAFIAQNVDDGRLRQLLPGDAKPDGQLLDVRTVPEYEANHLNGAINIPLQELRGRLDELDRDRPVMVTCGIGQRAYFACRILMQSGFADVWNLAGGLTMHEKAWKEASVG